ncbi:hypothetical protein BTO19_17820 [Vibrio parahaemolyticus]|uniref:three component ABC system middle component n=2 Tax=Vibrionaceae TaxID=641 RepID=UPI000471EDA7|nr:MULTISPECIES: three component ABC system middle component [Vibrio]ELE6587798.1 hypothetical protein [Vibrio alginolyticus]MDW2259899.1 three component ABC system middle component [Vibrio sp. 1409]EJC6947393.1 hypothetical protein [Vibrio parahaemolyticus]ELZ7197007.1 hypothetical protein [Vibrio parahaemolyticus]MBY7717672.1 hypothetical protein [Vibrio parahaemolyticus]
MNNQINLANCIFAIHSVLKISRSMSIDKILLIYPLLYQKPMLTALSRKKGNYKSLESIIIDHPEWFSNFNNIYYSSLTLSINAIQYMYEMEHIEIENGVVILKREIEYNKKMGSVVEKYYSSSTCVSNLLDKPSDYLYLNLRITL